MAIYRPIKKWLFPLSAAIIGILISMEFFPTKHDFTYYQWIKDMDNLEKNSYQVETIFHYDDRIYSKSKGSWSLEKAFYKVSTPLSDGTEFSFNTYFSSEKFYVQSGDQWKYGEKPHRLLHELTPLNHPFDWIRSFLPEAKQVIKTKKDETTTYMATFDTFSSYDFRGIELKDQKETTLIMQIENDDVKEITFSAVPIKPDDLGVFALYPEKMIYKINFRQTPLSSIPDIPKEAANAEEFD